MTISYHWLNDYLEGVLMPDRLAEILTNIGLEVESIVPFESVPGGLKNLLIGSVLEVTKHPDADRLKVTQVDVGNGKALQIVCGASNVAVGQRVIVASEGTVIFPAKGEPIKIKKSKIRGEVSEGMICAEDEIGLGTSHEGIVVLDKNAPVGGSVRDLFNVYTDTVIEIGITPNRADALSHRGVARDVRAFLRKPLADLFSKGPSDLTDAIQLPKDKKIAIEIRNPEDCYRFSGVQIQNVHIHESPSWLKNRLKAIGIKSINNVVDITNYISHDIGQPLHAYDADEISGGVIFAGRVAEGTPFTTLDGVVRQLSKDDLLICDEKGPLSIAGIFGGQLSGVKPTTHNLFIESACFNPVSIRKTARRLALKTDASFRFERGTDPGLTVAALQNAIQMVKELTGGAPSEIMDIYPTPIQPKRVTFRKKALDALVGHTFDEEEVTQILTAQGITVLTQSHSAWELEIPLFKNEVAREADVIEEVLRIYGYNQIPIPTQLKSSIRTQKLPEREKPRISVANWLSSNGFNEIMNNSLVASSSPFTAMIPRAGTLSLVNPLSSELNILRPSLIQSTLDTIAHNINRKQYNLKLYEFGKVYFKAEEQLEEETHLSICMTGISNTGSWQDPPKMVSLFDLKGVLETLFTRWGVPVKTYSTLERDFFRTRISWSLSGGSAEEQFLGFMGEVTGGLINTKENPAPVYYAEINWDLMLSQRPTVFNEINPIPKFPEVFRDLSLIVNEEIGFDRISSITQEVHSEAIQDVVLNSIYRGESVAPGKKSLNLTFTLVDEEHTLSEQEIQQVMNSLIERYETRAGALIKR